MVKGTGLESEFLFLYFFGNRPIADFPFNQSPVLVDAAHKLIRGFPLDVFDNGLGILEHGQFL